MTTKDGFSLIRDQNATNETCQASTEALGCQHGVYHVRHDSNLFRSTSESLLFWNCASRTLCFMLHFWALGCVESLNGCCTCSSTKSFFRKETHQNAVCSVSVKCLLYTYSTSLRNTDERLCLVCFLHPTFFRIYSPLPDESRQDFATVTSEVALA